MPKAAKEPKEKKAKDPNAPKRAAGAYIHFCNEKRDEVKKNNPDLKATEIMKELGSLWKDLSDKDKEPYEALAKKDKERYEKESAKYKADNPDAEPAKKGKKEAAPKKAAKGEGKAKGKAAGKKKSKKDEEEEEEEDEPEEEEEEEGENEEDADE